MKNYPNYQFDLTNCDKEPIHFIGRIQPHGFLFILNKSSLIIEQVSENVKAFLIDFTSEDLLGKPFKTLLSDKETAFDLLQSPEAENLNILTLSGKYFFCLSHLQGGKIIVECEPYISCPDAIKIKHNSLLSRLHKKLNLNDTIENLGNIIAEQLQEILDYDRVEVMQFDSDFHTHVFAESKKENLSSFLGHHFPASDIPGPARALLFEKPVRQIADVNANAVDIIPYLNPVTSAPTNILKSELRNPSEIHLEYLRNMEVSSTISFSIIVKNKLWGIITCHNLKAIFIDQWRRQLCDLVVKIFADAVAAIQEKSDVNLYLTFKAREQVIISELNKHPDLATGLPLVKQHLLDFTQSYGVAILLNNEIFAYGSRPSISQLGSLVEWLSQNNNDKVFYTQELSKLFMEAVHYKEIARLYTGLTSEIDLRLPA